MYFLTLDTNVIMEHWKNQKNASIVEKLLELAINGNIDLAITSRIHEDVPNLPLSERINQLEILHINEIPSVTRLDYWKIGRDILGDDIFINCVKSIIEELAKGNQKPPDWRDFDHLHAHFLLKRDAFLTWDKGILNISSILNEKLGIVIMCPEKFLKSYSR